MAIARVKTWSSQEVLASADLNDEFDNIIDSGQTIAFPLTATANVASQTLQNIGASSDFVAGSGADRNGLWGVMYKSITAVGNITSGTDDLMSYSMLANSMAVNANVIRVTVAGTTAGNGNTKTIIFQFGGTSLTINPTTTAPNGSYWYLQAYVYRTGAATQYLTYQAFVNATMEANSGNTTPAEDTTGAIVIKVTGNSGSSATDDVVQRMMLIEYAN